MSAQPLASLVLLAAPGSGGLPTALCGSYDSRVYAYSADFGRSLGSWDAHADAVSCLALTAAGSGGSVLLTGSWDCRLRLWALGEGRAGSQNS